MAAHAAALDIQTVEILTRAGRAKFTVEIADTPEANAKGLMFRRSLKTGHGMLFLYPSPQEITMWMRNTYIPLDMIFIRSDGRIHRIVAQTEPFSEEHINSDGDVTAVLEIGGGEAARLGIAEGDRLFHRHFGKK